MAIKNEKSYTLVLLTVLLVLVLFEKSARSNGTVALSGKQEGYSGRQELKNYAEPEINAAAAPVNDSPVKAPEPDLFVPEIPDIPDIENDPEDLNLTESGEKQFAVYFLKFYGKGNKSHSRLIRTHRKTNISGKNEVDAALELLVRGPDGTERSQGILSAVPAGMTWSEKFRIENHILHLSLGSKFEYGAGPELMKDRIDQIVYTLLEIDEIKGITLYIDGKKVKSIGGDGIPVPSVLTKNNRIIMTL